MDQLKNFSVRVSPADVGWAEFTVSVNGQVWSCHASYIADHPICEAIRAVVDLHDHFFREPYTEDELPLKVAACDEPGGIVLALMPQEGSTLLLSIHQFDDLDWPGLKNSDDKTLVTQGTISFWEFAEAVFHAACSMIREQGIAGFRPAWQPDRWANDAHFQGFPFDHFIFVAKLLKTGVPQHSFHSSLDEEIEILRAVRDGTWPGANQT